MSEALNYYKISHYEPYDGSDDIIVGHKSRFTDSELSVMVYDVIDDYVNRYADEDLYDDERRMPCDIAEEIMDYSLKLIEEKRK